MRHDHGAWLRAPARARTCNDPAAPLEHSIGVAEAARKHGVRNVAVTAGYLCPGSRAELFAPMDPINIDLQGFTEDFHSRIRV